MEGYLDVISPHQAGFENVVAPMGTALGEGQLRLIKRYTAGNHIVLALDPDAAGQKAILRGLDAARQSLDRETELKFDARGFLRYEARLQADLRVASLPDGLDPDKVVLRNPDEWKEIIANAKPVVTHVMESLAEGKNLDDPKVKTAIAAQVLPLISDLPNAIERETFRQQLARMLKIDERALIGGKTQGKRVSRRQPSSRRTNIQQSARQSRVGGIAVRSIHPSRKIEEYCLGILIRKPDLLYRLDRALQETGLHALSLDDFGYTENELLFETVKNSLEQDGLDAHDFVLESAPEDLAEMIERLLGETKNLSSVESKLLEEALRGVIKLRRSVLNDSLSQLRFFQQEAQEKSEIMGGDEQKKVMQHIQMLRVLDEARRKLSLRRME